MDGFIEFWNWKFWLTNGFHYCLFHVSVKPICINAQARFNWCVYFLQLVHFNEYCINVELLRMSILNTIRLRYVIGGATCTTVEVCCSVTKSIFGILQRAQTPRRCI